jgi:O-methyltransferase
VAGVKSASRRGVRRGPGTWYRRAKSIEFALGRDRAAILAFLRADYPIALPLRARLRLVGDFIRITNHVRTYHTQAEMLAVADRILRRAGRPDLTVLEAGAGKGGGTAKLSLVARLAGARLVVCDSFRGMPPNSEVHENLLGRRTEFREGAFRGTLSVVRRTVARFGAPERCEYVKGWFADTLPHLPHALDVVLLDVDLVESTRTCLRNLYPRIRPGGVLFSQDGHLRGTIDLLADRAFWTDDVGLAAPSVIGLGTRKLIEIAVDRPDVCGTQNETGAAHVGPPPGGLDTSSDRLVDESRLA